jgi:hypothetical protein
MRLFWIAAAALACIAAPTAGQVGSDARAAAAVERFTSPTLTRFRDDAEFEAYVRALREARRRRSALLGRRIQFAQARPQGSVEYDGSDPVCPQELPHCERFGTGSITVTGSRIATRTASITNNQMLGVDEGDIVKQIGRHLLVLSDGRISAIDTRPDGRPGLALSDRIDVYLDPGVDTWYDEMLVFGDRILVAGYSYEAGRTELSVFRLSDDGRLSREGLFTRRTNDYYSASNYATRIVGDSLVIYSVYAIAEWDEDEPFGLASMRSWVAGAPEQRAGDWDRAAFEGEAEAVFAALVRGEAIYRPVRTETDPSVHAFSVCPLAPLAERRALDCRTRAFVGPATAEWYVTADEALLWAYGNEDAESECRRTAFGHSEIVSALIYRVPHGAASPSVAGARGEPFDQFSLQLNDGRLRALVDRRPGDCWRTYGLPKEPWYVELPLTDLSQTTRELPEARYAVVPNPGMNHVTNRFTERHLVYGGLSQYRSGFPRIDPDDFDDDPGYRERVRRSLMRPPAFVVPAGRPDDVRRLDIGHSVIRIERFGENDVVLTGYRDRRGLSVSLIDLDEAPRIGSTIMLAGRFESEGRSHAFNALTGAGGRGTIALPTMPRNEGRPWWRSRPSDMSFLSVASNHRLGDLGLLTSSLVADLRRRDGDEEDEDGLEGYKCEVSCIDWYGNSRPIFTDGRIFALLGGEIVEGRRGTREMIELRRLDFLRAVPRRRPG